MERGQEALSSRTVAKCRTGTPTTHPRVLYIRLFTTPQSAETRWDHTRKRIRHRAEHRRLRVYISVCAASFGLWRVAVRSPKCPSSLKTEAASRMLLCLTTASGGCQALRRALHIKAHIPVYVWEITRRDRTQEHLAAGTRTDIRGGFKVKTGVHWSEVGHVSTRPSHSVYALHPSPVWCTRRPDRTS